MPKIFITILFLLGAVVAGTFYLYPEWKTFQALRRQTQALRDTSSEFDDLMQNRTALLEEINRVSKDDLNRIDQALPQGQKTASILVLIETLTGANGLRLQRLDIADASGEKKSPGGQPKPGGLIVSPEQTQSVKELPIQIQVVGSYDSFKKFLRALELNLPLVDTTGITFGTSGTGGGFDFTLKVKTYYQ